MRHHHTSSALVDHVDKAGHLLDWKGARSLHQGLHRNKRKAPVDIKQQEHQQESRGNRVGYTSISNVHLQGYRSVTSALQPFSDNVWLGSTP